MLHGVQQLILEPTYLLLNSLSSIDLIFTDQSNLVVNSGVLPSLHPNCHHQIIYCKFNLMIKYPPAYERFVWDYKHSNENAIANSTVPNSLQCVSPARLSSFSFSEKVILKIINDLNINKAHEHDHISIGMIKLCSKSVVKALSIFKNCIDTGTFPDIWKRSNIIPTQKKGDKQIINNYRTVSLLPIFGKIFEKLYTF